MVAVLERRMFYSFVPNWALTLLSLLLLSVVLARPQQERSLRMDVEKPIVEGYSNSVDFTDEDEVHFAKLWGNVTSMFDNKSVGSRSPFCSAVTRQGKSCCSLTAYEIMYCIVPECCPPLLGVDHISPSTSPYCSRCDATCTGVDQKPLVVPVSTGLDYFETTIDRQGCAGTLARSTSSTITIDKEDLQSVRMHAVSSVLEQEATGCPLKNQVEATVRNLDCTIGPEECTDFNIYAYSKYDRVMKVESRIETDAYGPFYTWNEAEDSSGCYYYPYRDSEAREGPSSDRRLQFVQANAQLGAASVSDNVAREPRSTLSPPFCRRKQESGKSCCAQSLQEFLNCVHPNCCPYSDYPPGQCGFDAGQCSDSFALNALTLKKKLDFPTSTDTNNLYQFVATTGDVPIGCANALDCTTVKVDFTYILPTPDWSDSNKVGVTVDIESQRNYIKEKGGYSYCGTSEAYSFYDVQGINSGTVDFTTTVSYEAMPLSAEASPIPQKNIVVHVHGDWSYTGSGVLGETNVVDFSNIRVDVLYNCVRES